LEREHWIKASCITPRRGSIKYLLLAPTPEKFSYTKYPLKFFVTKRILSQFLVKQKGNL
jgi:hypothetical protein